MKKISEQIICGHGPAGHQQAKTMREKMKTFAAPFKVLLVCIALVFGLRSMAVCAGYVFLTDSTGAGSSKPIQGTTVPTANWYMSGSSDGVLDSVWIWIYSNGGANDSVQCAVYTTALALVSNTPMKLVSTGAGFNKMSLDFGHSGSVTANTRYWVTMRAKTSAAEGGFQFYTATTPLAADSGAYGAADADPLNTTLSLSQIRAGDFSSDFNSFRIRVFYSDAGGGSAPSIPVPSSPASSSTDQSSAVILSWNASSTGSPTSYSVMVCSDTAGTTKVSTDSTATASLFWTVSPSLAVSTKYFWKVNAHNANGWSGWSPTWSFTTAAATPSAPTLSSPADAANPVASPYSLAWNAATGATSYTLQVSTSATLTGGAGTGFVTTTPYNANVGNVTTANPTGLSGSTVYYWHVSATNGNGTSAYSTAVRSFTTAAAASGNRAMFKK